MVRIALDGFFAALNDLLHRPWIVLWVCLGLAFVNLVLDGTLLNVWSLNRDLQGLKTDAAAISRNVGELNKKIRLATDPAFVEREARDHFDLVTKGDLVFVFADDE